MVSINLHRREFLKLMAGSVAGLILATRVGKATQAANRPVPRTASLKATYHESPVLHAKVVAGNLPPVEQRLPTTPLTLTPIDGTGQYGGALRQLWGGSWAGYFQEAQYGHSPLRWVDDGLAIAPGWADTWSANADNSVWTIHMREGLKWSDGQDCTIDDVLFWWNDLTQATDPSQPDSVPDFGTDSNGMLVQMAKVDNYTLTLTYGTPAPLTAKRLAMWVNANIGPRLIAPAHYLKQFHPKYNAAVTDFTDLVNKATTWTNPAMPTLNAWILTDFQDGVSLAGARNPYYYAVDSAGNQLPYIDSLDWTNIPTGDPALIVDKIKSGLIDMLPPDQNNLSLADIPGLELGQTAGNYDVWYWDSGSGTGMVYFWNYDVAEAKLRALYRTPEFKQAMSFAINRPAIQHSVYFDTGFPTTGTLSPKAYEFNFNPAAQAFFTKARDLYVAYDPAKAKALLDKIGCKAGPGGFRTYPDGTPMTINIDLTSDAGYECLSVLAITKQNWIDVGLNVVVNMVDPSQFDNLWRKGQLTFHSNWEVGDGPDHLLYPSWLVPNEPSRWAPLCGGVLQYAGTPLENTETEKSPWDRNPPRFNKNDADYKGTPVETIHNLYAQTIKEPDALIRAQLVWQMWTIHEQSGPFFIGTVANYPRIVVKSKELINVPSHNQLRLGGFVNPWIIPYPAITNPETWSYSEAAVTVLDPVTILEGSAGFTLKVTGHAIRTDSVVYWNGSALATTFVKAGQLSAVVPASAIAAAGTAKVAIYNPAPIDVLTDSLDFTITAHDDPHTSTVPVTPASPATLGFTSPTDPTLNTQVAIPAGAVASNAQLVYTEGSGVPTGTSGNFEYNGRYFSLSAYEGGAMQSGFTFAQPVLVTLTYPANLPTNDLNILSLYFWDSANQKWSTVGITLVSRDPAHNQVVFQITHLSQFALLAPGNRVFLPYVDHK